MLAWTLAALALTAPVRAIELSLEENRTQRGSVGYVDMQRVFAESPDAAAAKESFEGLVREAEERVNLKRAEILKLRQELDADKAEREKLSREAAVVSSAAAVSAPHPAPAPVPAVPAPVTASTAAAPAPLRTMPPPPLRSPGGAAPVSITALPPGAPVSTAPAANVMLSTTALAALLSTAPVAALPPAALPGLPTGSSPLTAPPAVLASTPAAVAVSSSPAPAGPRAAGVALSTAAAPAPAAVAASTRPASGAPPAAGVALSTAAPAAAPPPAAAVAGSTSPAAAMEGIAGRVLDLDVKIIALQADILRKEEALARERNETDKGLVSIEGRKTDQVLVRVYRAITTVAQQEGVSIVVDRSSILYGHQGVDLTDKVLQYLRSSAQ
jgi:Skp family chaperone for outer membrane proteins